MILNQIKTTEMAFKLDQYSPTSKAHRFIPLFYYSLAKSQYTIEYRIDREC